MHQPSALKIYFSFLVILLLCKDINGQMVRTLKGYVKDQQQELIGANISIRNIKNKDLMKAAFTENDGRFEMMFVSPDTILMEVSYLGYESVTKEIIFGGEAVYNAGDIILETTSIKVNEITVSASKSFAVQKIDRVIINP
jgi:iron complex outermembrane receptor protein